MQHDTDPEEFYFSTFTKPDMTHDNIIKEISVTQPEKNIHVFMALMGTIVGIVGTFYLTKSAAKEDRCNSMVMIPKTSIPIIFLPLSLIGGMGGCLLGIMVAPFMPLFLTGGLISLPAIIYLGL